MQPEWTIVAWDPNRAGPELWQAFHVYRRQRAKEHDATNPVTEDAVVEGHIRKPDVWSIDHRYLARAGDRVVGACTISASKPGSAGYESGKHIMYTNLAVLEDWQRRGIASAWLPEMARRMHEHEATVMTLHSSEPSGQAFLDWVGAESKMVERVSRLYFDQVDWSQLADWEAALAVRAPGTTLELYPDRLPEAFLKEYCPAREEMMNLMPFEDMEHGRIEIRPEDFEEMYKRLALDESAHHTYISREPDGRISGITDISWSPKDSGVVHQWFTGVHPDYRGRGLGKALKAAMLRYANERYEGLTWVSTGNAASNASMLAINEAMGFRVHRVYHTYQIGLDALEAFVADRGIPPLKLAEG